jgi:hypothetical protein
MKKLIVVAVAGMAAAGLYATPASASQATECSGTLSGTYDRIVVPDGATCTLDGATVTKGVTVGAGSSLYTTNATIGGNLMARHAHTVHVIDTNVGHNIKVSGTTHMTKIGDAACMVDPTVGHNVMVKGNSGPTAICSLSIGNNLAVFDNTGSVGIFSNNVTNNLLTFRNSGNATRLRYNTVGINLNCEDNTSPIFVNLGNTAGGAAMGQCA